MSRARDREEFVVLMSQEGVPLDVSRKVMRHARTIQRLAEEYCNRELSPAEEKKDVRAEDKIKELLIPYNIAPIFQADPRGACVKLRVPSGKTNDWGQEGICVPT